MTQERTEQRDMKEIREAFYRMIKGEHSLHIPAQTSDEDFVIGAALDELEAARAEIDRLNLVITGQAEAIKEQTAKVQERDEAIKEWERRFGTRTNTAWDALAERDKEIERLRAAMKSVISTGWRDGNEDNDGIPYIESNFEAVEIAIEALKGVE